MVRNSSSTLWWTVRAYVSSGAGNPAPNSSSDMPTMPFIGVRISWLIIARKRDLAWLAASAWALSGRIALALADDAQHRGKGQRHAQHAGHRNGAQRPQIAPPIAR
jgi:hypothetical protein